MWEYCKRKSHGIDARHGTKFSTAPERTLTYPIPNYLNDTQIWGYYLGHKRWLKFCTTNVPGEENKRPPETIKQIEAAVARHVRGAEGKAKPKNRKLRANQADWRRKVAKSVEYLAV